MPTVGPTHSKITLLGIRLVAGRFDFKTPQATFGSFDIVSGESKMHTQVCVYTENPGRGHNAGRVWKGLELFGRVLQGSQRFGNVQKGSEGFGKVCGGRKR